MASLTRQISANISDQQTEGTCYAHSLTRIILNAIRQTIPTFFYPMENDMCNKIYWSGTFDTVSQYIKTHNCGTHSANNLLMFSYIYNTLINEHGCQGGFVEEILEWYSQTYIKTEFGTEDSIRSALPTISKDNLENIQHICREFTDTFFYKQNNLFVFQRFKIRDLTDLNIIKYVLDNGYYIGVVGKKHIVTAVGFKQHMGHLLIVLKNSWGNLTSYDTKLKSPINDGIVTMTIDRLLDADFNELVFIIPNNLSDRDVEKVKRKQVMNELIDKHRRKTLRNVGGRKKKRAFRKSKTNAPHKEYRE